jgi:hypothetical protein
MGEGVLTSRRGGRRERGSMVKGAKVVKVAKVAKAAG